MNNRPLKFRFWNGFKFVNFRSLKILIDENGKIFSYSQVYGLQTRDKDHVILDTYIVQQFTGLLDKNGVEIFEGDLIEVSYNSGHERDSTYDIFGKFKVIFHDGEFIAVCDGQDNLSLSLYASEYMYKKKELEKFNVVGNIFENPEMSSNT